MRSNFSRSFSRLVLGCCLILPLVGCSFGPNNPNVQNALEMLRIERDAAEDEYYSLKQKHDEALWKIEDLESQIKSIQEDDGAASVSHEELIPLDNTIEETIVDETAMNSSDNSYPPLPVHTDVSIVSGGVRSEVSYVDIDTRMTRGFDSHGKPGDDGIVVAIKPMDESGEFLPIAAPVQIALIDPARSGIRQRVGLWRFTSKQVANKIDHKNNVFMFRLPWQRSAPIHSNLKLFVRYQADDGKRETEMDLAVAVDGQPVIQQAPSNRWTEIKKAEDTIDLSPSNVQGPLVESNLESRSGSGESPLRIARPEWSPFR